MYILKLDFFNEYTSDLEIKFYKYYKKTQKSWILLFNFIVNEYIK